MPRLPGLLAISLLFALPAWGRAGEPWKAVPEYTMKAAYLYNFAQLTDWPTDSVAGGEFHLCIYGQDEFGGALDALRDKLINGRKVRIRYISEPAEARLCHMLFISQAESKRNTSRLFDVLRGYSVLTVSDNAQEVPGSTISLSTTKEQRLSFAIDIDAGKRAQLRFSSKLLALAKRVIGE